MTRTSSGRGSAEPTANMPKLAVVGQADQQTVLDLTDLGHRPGAGLDIRQGIGDRRLEAA